MLSLPDFILLLAIYRFEEHFYHFCDFEENNFVVFLLVKSVSASVKCDFPVELIFHLHLNLYTYFYGFAYVKFVIVLCLLQCFF